MNRYIVILSTLVLWSGQLLAEDKINLFLDTSTYKEISINIGSMIFLRPGGSYYRSVENLNSPMVRKAISTYRERWEKITMYSFDGKSWAELILKEGKPVCKKHDISSWYECEFHLIFKGDPQGIKFISDEKLLITDFKGIPSPKWSEVDLKTHKIPTSEIPMFSPYFGRYGVRKRIVNRKDYSLKDRFERTSLRPSFSASTIRPKKDPDGIESYTIQDEGIIIYKYRTNLDLIITKNGVPIFLIEDHAKLYKKNEKRGLTSIFKIKGVEHYLVEFTFSNFSKHERSSHLLRSHKDGAVSSVSRKYFFKLGFVDYYMDEGP